MNNIYLLPDCHATNFTGYCNRIYSEGLAHLRARPLPVWMFANVLRALVGTGEAK